MSHNTAVRFSDADIRRLKSEAADAGLSMASYIRRALRASEPTRMGRTGRWENEILADLEERLARIEAALPESLFR